MSAAYLETKNEFEYMFETIEKYCKRLQILIIEVYIK